MPHGLYRKLCKHHLQVNVGIGWGQRCQTRPEPESIGKEEHEFVAVIEVSQGLLSCRSVPQAD